MLLRRSKRLGTGLSITDGRRRLACMMGGGGAAKGQVWRGSRSTDLSDTSDRRCC